MRKKRGLYNWTLSIGSSSHLTWCWGAKTLVLFFVYSYLVWETHWQIQISFFVFEHSGIYTIHYACLHLPPNFESCTSEANTSLSLFSTTDRSLMRDLNRLQVSSRSKFASLVATNLKVSLIDEVMFEWMCSFVSSWWCIFLPLWSVLCLGAQGHAPCRCTKALHMRNHAIVV